MNVTYLGNVRFADEFLAIASKEGWEQDDFSILMTDEKKRREILLLLRGDMEMVMPEHVSDRLMWGSLFPELRRQLPTTCR
jgi:hypothetical protein